jgi:hypothetical protein
MARQLPAAAAAVVGVPLGVIRGRLGWNAVADQIDVATKPATPILAIVCVLVGSVVTANLIAASPGWLAPLASTSSVRQRLHARKTEPH